MTGHDDFDRTLAGWFEADALTVAPADGLERTLHATRRRRPRPAWLAGPGSLWIGESLDAGAGSRVRSFPRVGEQWSTGLILLLALAALAAGAILVGAQLLHRSPLPAGRLGHLAYALDGDIFVADWDGGNPVRVADGPPGGDSTFVCGRVGSGLAWSPDGRHLAYRSDWGDGCQGRVVIGDAAGRLLASVPGVGWDIHWSPDSTRLVTWVDLFQTIGVYRADGVRQSLLSLPPGTVVIGNHEPFWSTDSASLLLRLGQRSPEGAQSASRIWELPVDGRRPRPLPDDDVRQLEPAYSPDGKRVAYGPNNSSSIVIAQADGTELRVLPGENPVWSPMGDRVAYTSSPRGAGSGYDKSGSPLPSPHELRVVDVASGSVTTLAGDSEINAIGFSPEGDRVLFWRAGPDGMDALWSVDADGSDAQPLATGTQSGDWQRLPADH